MPIRSSLLSSTNLTRLKAIAEAKPRYTGPATPIKYDESWRQFGNLTKDQAAAFEAMPENLAKIATDYRHNAVRAGTPKTATAAEAIAAVQAAYATEATLLSVINATPPTVTMRAQVDAAFAPKPVNTGD